MKLNHIALWTIDLERSSKFWVEFFEAELSDRFESVNRLSFAPRFATLPNEDVRIELMEGPWVKPCSHEEGGWAHVAFSVGSVSNVDAVADRFKHAGLLVSEPRRTGDGYYEAVVRSPEGLMVEIVE